jgi:hypothetical protein
LTQLRRIFLASFTAVISWLLLKLILVPEDTLIVHLGSDKVLTGYIEYSTTLPWARSAQQVLSPEQITLEDGQPREVTLVLEPLGQSHPQGLGSEIWIYEIASELERVGPERFDSLHLPASWKYDEKRRAIVFLGGEHTPLSLRLKAIGKVSLRLLRHPWSGQARVTVDGMSRVVDLYSSEFRRVQEVFLLQLPLEVTQRIETVLPRTTQQARLVFTGGPRLVRLERVEWHSRSVWAWDPKRDTFEVGPGVQILEKSEEGWLIQIEQSDGWIAFHDLQTKPFFLPGSWGVIVILLLGFVWWTVWETYRPRTRVGAFLRGQAYWAKYALPCLTIWLVYWLAFFPALMNVDSLAQWHQILGIWPMNDDHPAFHTLMMWLLTRLWFSPAVIALAQMVAMSGLIGWGLAGFARLGVPRVILWSVCGLFALSPVMGTMTITLLKDIPYGMSVLWLTLLILKIIVSHGEWLKSSRWNIVLLGVALVCVALFRHNGVLVSLGTIVIIGGVYRPYWKQILIAFFIAASIYGVVRGPLYNVVGVRRVTDYLLYQVPVHQVAAVVAAGTPLTSEERSILDKLFPIDKWGKAYVCSSIHSIYYAHDFNYPLIDSDSEYKAAFRRVWLSLLLRNPLAVIRHQLCAGALVWLVPPLTYLYTVEREIPQNELGLSTQSQWPAMRRLITKLLDWSERPEVIWLLWRPALYLYIILLLTAAVAYRMQEPRWLIFAVPAMLQSVSLLLVNVGQDFRYQFSIYLISLISLCLLWWIIPKHKEAQEK